MFSSIWDMTWNPSWPEPIRNQHQSRKPAPKKDTPTRIWFLLLSSGNQSGWRKSSCRLQNWAALQSCRGASVLPQQISNDNANIQADSGRCTPTPDEGFYTSTVRGDSKQSSSKVATSRLWKQHPLLQRSACHCVSLSTLKDETRLLAEAGGTRTYITSNLMILAVILPNTLHVLPFTGTFQPSVSSSCSPRSVAGFCGASPLLFRSLRWCSGDN